MQSAFFWGENISKDKKECEDLENWKCERNIQKFGTLFLFLGGESPFTYSSIKLICWFIYHRGYYVINVAKISLINYYTVAFFFLHHYHQQTDHYYHSNICFWFKWTANLNWNGVYIVHCIQCYCTKYTVKLKIIPFFSLLNSC